MSGICGGPQFTCGQNWTFLHPAPCALWFDIDPVEFGVLVGRIELEAKLQRIYKIFTHRKRNREAKKIKKFIKHVEKLKPQRNAIVHGYYVGLGENGMEFILTTDFMISDNALTGVKRVTIDVDDLVKHNYILVELLKILVKIAKPKRLNELFSLPAHSNQLMAPPLHRRRTIKRPTPRRSSRA
jgi:hypothetical protein